MLSIALLTLAASGFSVAIGCLLVIALVELHARIARSEEEKRPAPTITYRGKPVAWLSMSSTDYPEAAR